LAPFYPDLLSMAQSWRYEGVFLSKHLLSPVLSRLQGPFPLILRVDFKMIGFGPSAISF
jgi:hypothetical protein